jgi:glycosyltransferase involved in cell wall biosynthesis
VRARLAASDVFFLPSWSEGFPISLIEAMAAGLPVVASSAGAIPKVVDQGRGGYVIDPLDAAGFIEALRTLRDDPAKIDEMGRYNRAKAMSDYDYGTGVRKLTEVYRHILMRPV